MPFLIVIFIVIVIVIVTIIIVFLVIFGAYGSLPDAAIWWCLWTGGGGILTSSYIIFKFSFCSNFY